MSTKTLRYPTYSSILDVLPSGDHLDSHADFVKKSGKSQAQLDAEWAELYKQMSNS